MRPSFDEIAELNALELCRPARMTFADAARRLTNAEPCGSTFRAMCPYCKGADTLSLGAFPDGNARLVCFRCYAPMNLLVALLREVEAGSAPGPEFHSAS